MADKQLRVIIVGDASSVQRAMRETEQATATAQVKVEGFGKAFAQLGAAFGVGASAADTAIGVLKSGVDAVIAYNTSVDQSSKLILGFTRSQAALAQAQALANKEQDAGRATYDATLQALAALLPLANKYNLQIADVLHTTELLAAIDPEQGFEGARIALQEALSGDFTSLSRRFELPLSAIQKLKDEGVPNLQIVQKVLADLGYDQQFLDTANTSNAKTLEILKGQLIQIGDEISKGFFNDLAAGVKATSDQLKDAQGSLHDFVGVFEDAQKSINDINHDVDQAGNSFGKGILQKLHDIPNSRSADDPVERWFQEQFKRYDRGAAELADRAKKATEKGTEGATQGFKPTPTQTAQAEGYGRQLVESFLAGASGVQIDQLTDLTKLIPSDLKPGTDAYTAALSDLVQAQKEVAATGNISETTLYKLNSVFGAQTPQIANLIILQGQLNAKRADQQKADDAATKAEKDLADAQKSAADDIKIYQDALDDATKAQKDHRQAAQDAEQAISDQIATIQAQAAASTKARQAQLDGLQEGLDSLQQTASQHAAARQAEIAAAQAQLSAASQQRQNDQALLNAALSGELEYEEQILDGLTDQQRAIAAKWQAEIDGQRRAKEGANQKVTDLSRAAHLEDQKALHEIDALRKGGHEAEARRAERALAEKQKQRAAAMTLAQADAAVANDQFDAAEEQVKKEGQAQDVKDTQAERAAQANLTRIQDAAKAQADADKAAIDAQQDRIKQVQAEQKAEQGRYQDRIDHLNDDIKTVKANAKVQDGIDQDRVDWAQELLTKTQNYWKTQIAGLKDTADDLKTQATNMKSIADDAERAEQAEEKRYNLYKNNPAGSPTGPPQPSGAAGAQGGARDQNATPQQASGAGGATGDGGDRWLPENGPRGWGPAIPGGSPPPGFHVESRPSGVWWVRDGHTLNDAGTALVAPQPTPSPGPTPSPAPSTSPTPGQNTGPGSYPQPGPAPSPAPGPSTGGPGGLSRVGLPGESFQRASLGGAEPAANGARQTTIQIVLPNVRDLGDPAQRATMWREIEREWDDVERGGHTKRDVA